LVLERERRAEERKSGLPDLRLDRESLRVARIQVLPEDVPDEAMVEIKARSYGASIEIELDAPERFRVTVPFPWTGVAADTPAVKVEFPPCVFETRRLRPGARIRIWDEHSGAEDAITIE
jgi:hypothetical protein